MLIITVLSGVTVIVNLLASIVDAAQGTQPRLQLFMGVIFCLALFTYIGWWTILIAVVLILMMLIAVGLWNKSELEAEE